MINTLTVGYKTKQVSRSPSEGKDLYGCRDPATTYGGSGAAEICEVGEEGMRACGGFRWDTGVSKVCVRELRDAEVSGEEGKDLATQFEASYVLVTTVPSLVRTYDGLNEGEGTFGRGGSRSRCVRANLRLNALELISERESDAAACDVPTDRREVVVAAME